MSEQDKAVGIKWIETSSTRTVEVDGIDKTITRLMPTPMPSHGKLQAFVLKMLDSPATAWILWTAYYKGVTLAQQELTGLWDDNKGGVVSDAKAALYATGHIKEEPFRSLFAEGRADQAIAAAKRKLEGSASKAAVNVEAADAKLKKSAWSKWRKNISVQIHKELFPADNDATHEVAAAK